MPLPRNVVIHCGGEPSKDTSHCPHVSQVTRTPSSSSSRRMVCSISAEIPLWVTDICASNELAGDLRFYNDGTDARVLHIGAPVASVDFGLYNLLRDGFGLCGDDRLRSLRDRRSDLGDRCAVEVVEGGEVIDRTSSSLRGLSYCIFVGWIITNCVTRRSPHSLPGA